MSQTTPDYSEKTRAIYHEQHMRIAKDDTAMRRFIDMFSTDYFGLEQDFFVGKKILDAGCGDTAKVIIALSEMGASELHGIDLGTDFVDVAKESIKRQGCQTDNVYLNSGSVLNLPYEDSSFDFVVCHGVLLHLNSLDEVKQAFSELARVTKPGGLLYTVYGIVGGLLEEAIIPAVRQYYDNNTDFKAFIDDVKPEDFQEATRFASGEILSHTGEDHDLSHLNELLDVDFCVMLQNLIQAPVRLAIPEDMVRDLYTKHHFGQARRLRRYVKRQNLRKYLAPFHYEYDHPISQLMWGSGNLEFISQKSKI